MDSIGLFQFLDPGNDFYRHALERIIRDCPPSPFVRPPAPRPAPPALAEPLQVRYAPGVDPRLLDQLNALPEEDA